MKRKLGIFAVLVTESLILENHLILTVLHMIGATGLRDNLIFLVRNLEEAEVGDLGMTHRDHMTIHVQDGKMHQRHLNIQSS